MGGRIAEEMIFGDITSGAQGDIKAATRLARKMICEWGMSEKLGFLEYGEKEEHIFLGRDMTRSRDFSEATALAIDQEVRQIIEKCYKRAEEILAEKKDKLTAMARALLEYETLDGQHVEEILKHGKLLKPPRKPVPAPSAPAKPVVAPGTVKAKSPPDAVTPPPGALPSPAV